MMRIIVDEMPRTPHDCPYSVYSGEKWCSCSKRAIVCQIGEHGWQCPIFTEMKCYKEELK